MNPREDQDPESLMETRLVYTCRNETCNSSEVQSKENYMIQRNQIYAKKEEQKPSKMVFFALKNDPTLMKVAKECPRPDCGGREARTLHQTKGDDTGLTQYNICCECGEEIS